MSDRTFHFGVQVVIRDGGRVLLIKREDYEVWGLPGGGVENGETLVEAAVRETHEETGLEVRIVRLIGTYARVTENCYNIAYEGEVIGGTLLTQFPKEVLELAYFDHCHLPDHTINFYRRMVEDAFTHYDQPPSWKLTTPTAFCGVGNYRELYAIRDASGLSRREFYLKYFGDEAGYREIREY